MLRQEKGKALVRALHLSELETAGRARAVALHEADVQLDKIAHLMPLVLESGISITDIGRVTGVSRPTLYELRGRYGVTLGDLRFSLLQAVATRQPVTIQELKEHFADRPEFDEVLRELDKQGLTEYGIESVPIEDDGSSLVVAEDTPVVLMTPDGYQALEQWDFDALASAHGDDEVSS